MEMPIHTTMYERAEILAGGIVNDNSYKSPGVAENDLQKYFQRTLDLSPHLKLRCLIGVSRMQWNDAVRKMFDRSTLGLLNQCTKLL